MGVRVNWTQGNIASDGLIRMHIIEKERPECQFNKMKNYSDFCNEEEAKQKIQRKGYSKYKHCNYCWDNAIIEIK